MTTTITFPRPAPPLTMNDRQHWAARARTVQAWRHVVYWHAISHRPALQEPAVVGITIDVRHDRRRDNANWHPTLKACVDGLTDARFWPDDNAEWVTTTEPVLRVVPAGAPLTVTLTVTPRAAA